MIVKMGNRMIRRQLDGVYKQLRRTDIGIDSRISSFTLLLWIGGKVRQRARAFFRGYPNAFIGRQFRPKSRHQLFLADAVSIGDCVTIDAMAAEGIRIGRRSTIDDYAILRGSGVVRNLGEGITIGENTSIGAYNVILGQGGVSIGADCLLGPNVTILSENHNFGDVCSPIRSQGETRIRTEVGDNVWIGAGAVVLGGSRIGEGAVVAAGAVVRGDVEPYTIVGGVPARVIRHRMADK